MNTCEKYCQWYIWGHKAAFLGVATPAFVPRNVPGAEPGAILAATLPWKALPCVCVESCEIQPAAALPCYRGWHP